MANIGNVWVIVPNWNGADYIYGCIASLSRQSLPVNILVVDNGSVDDSVNIIENNFPNVTILKNNKNLGFSGGVNIGINFALKQSAEAIALFNNDAVAEEAWLKDLVTAMEHDSNVGIVTGRLLRKDKKHLDTTGECYSIWGLPFPRGRNRKDSGQFNKSEEVFAATGGASLYRASMLRQIGLFDENFFAYLEDIDISFRARLGGWKVLYEPSAVAFHEIGATSSRLGTFTRYHFVKNFHLTYIKNMPGILFWKYLPFFIIQSLRLAVGLIAGGHLMTLAKSYLVTILLLPGAFLKRFHIQSQRKIRPTEIDAQLHHARPPVPPNIYG